ncbi:hypothetical protein SRB5_36970 [Streptomyces sp. RB5]|uniref:Lipid/polyisoprenoid-binding YceI-like domain-containing protein n=1 Tax=Streptomyces smaragdinus TaxID=2585196 RepID=A0A7K0CJ88_9ACTN|nr:YceI family protein [Streptomyces smaragdinus]MQY13549.1 hypothetical protein [Streptomyces smaragdinus]
MFDDQLVEFPKDPPSHWPAGLYAVDPSRTTIAFTFRYGMVARVRGRFTAFEGLLRLGPAGPAGFEAHLSVQTGSVETGQQAGDALLAGPERLDAVRYPLMSFRSTGTSDADGDQFLLAGLLRIKDRELPLELGLEYCGAGPAGVRFEGGVALGRGSVDLDIAAVRLDA